MAQRGVELILLVGSLLSACHAKQRQKPADYKSIAACMRIQSRHDDYSLVTACQPLGPQAKLEGTWFVGFELSVFRQGYSGVPAEQSTDTKTNFEMVVPSALEERAHASDSEGPSAYQVTFLGRMSEVSWMRGVGLVVADKVLSMHRVAVSPMNEAAPKRGVGRLDNR